MRRMLLEHLLANWRCDHVLDDQPSQAVRRKRIDKKVHHTV